MSDAEAMREVRAIIRFYSRRHWNWLAAVEFTLVKHSGTLEAFLHPYRWCRKECKP